MTRRTALGALAAGAVSCSRAARRPNILFAIADDWSFPHAGAYGSSFVNTPNFDRVAREGVLFQNSFTAAPSCTPSRSAILSGRPIWQCGEAGLLYGTVPKDLPLFPHKLADTGYHTGFTGKSWAPGDWKAAGLERHPVGKEFNSRRHTPVPHAAIDPRDYAANFEDFLKDRPANAPFFFWCGATEPHRVYEPGAGLKLGKKLDSVKVPSYWPDTDVLRSDILDYAAEVDWFDTQLGRVLAVLEKSGELDNTLIVVTSDNGMPFPRAKVNVYDPGTRMPLAVRWPGRFSGGRSEHGFVSHTDFAATFLTAAGIGGAQQGLLGPPRDFAVSAVERHTYCRPDGATYPMRSFRTATHLYIRNFAPDRWPTGGEFLSSNRTTHGDVDACPTKDFLLSEARKYPREHDLNFGRRPSEELYELATDPDCIRNLAGDAAHSAALTSSRSRLETHLKETADPRIEGKDPWQAMAYRQTIGFGASFNTALPESERQKAAGRGSHKPE